MKNVEVMSFYSWKVLSWEKSRLNILKLQKRIFKSTLVGDVKMSLLIQKVLLLSNSTRLVSIHIVLGLSLSCKETFFYKDFNLKKNLNKLLSMYIFNWCPGHMFLESSFLSIYNKEDYFLLADLCWQYVVLFALKPSHDVILSPLSFTFSVFSKAHVIQRILITKFSRNSFGNQKRLLKLDLHGNIVNFNFGFLLNKMVTLKVVKVIIFRFLKLGLSLKINVVYKNDLGSLLTAILFDRLFENFDFLQLNTIFVFFLYPHDDFFGYLSLVNLTLSKRGLVLSNKNFSMVSLLEGFNLFGWYFKYSIFQDIVCLPSLESYRYFLKRVKTIINNSNYGAVSLRI